MITISKESLIHKFLNFYISDWNMPTNLCQLVKCFILTLFQAIIMWGIVVYIAFSFLVSLFALLFFDMTWLDSGFGASTFIIFCAVIVFTCIYGSLWAKEKLENKIDNYLRNKPASTYVKAKAKKPWLIVEYYKSIKGKYCPQIEFK